MVVKNKSALPGFLDVGGGRAIPIVGWCKQRLPGGEVKLLPMVEAGESQEEWNRKADAHNTKEFIKEFGREPTDLGEVYRWIYQSAGMPWPSMYDPPRRRENG